MDSYLLVEGILIIVIAIYYLVETNHHLEILADTGTAKDVYESKLAALNVVGLSAAQLATAQAEFDTAESGYRDVAEDFTSNLNYMRVITLLFLLYTFQSLNQFLFLKLTKKKTNVFFLELIINLVTFAAVTYFEIKCLSYYK